ncbi:MAG: C39 family peptidase [Lachnospiraceae bacterium]
MDRRYYYADNQYNKRRIAHRKKYNRRKKIRRIKIIICEVLMLAVLVGVLLLRIKGKEGLSVDSLRSLTKKEEIERFAKKHNLSMDDYPQDLIELYERNPETKDFVFEYPLKKEKEYEIDLSEYKNTESVPLFMQWDERWGYKMYSGNLMGLTGCGPTCLSMVAVYLSGDTSMDPSWMADFSEEHGYVAEGNGSAWALFSEGGERLGFDVTEIPLDQQRIIDNLEVGNPIVASMGAGDFTTGGHFIVFSGYQDGKIKVNDPNSRKNSEKLWDYDRISGQIKQLWIFR